jgi:hypothetical protein
MLTEDFFEKHLWSDWEKRSWHDIEQTPHVLISNDQRMLKDSAGAPIVIPPVPSLPTYMQQPPSQMTAQMFQPYTPPQLQYLTVQPGPPQTIIQYAQENSQPHPMIAAHQPVAVQPGPPKTIIQNAQPITTQPGAVPVPVTLPPGMQQQQPQIFHPANNLSLQQTNSTRTLMNLHAPAPTISPGAAPVVEANEGGAVSPVSGAGTTTPMAVPA